VPTAIARRREGYIHDVEVDGHAILVDESESQGGSDRGPSPNRLLAAALASCTAITVEMYANRKGWDPGPVEVEVEMEYGKPSVPRSFVVTLKLPKELGEEQRVRLEEIAKRCPVHKVVAHDTEIDVEDRLELV
jgi:putative redox protein